MKSNLSVWQWSGGWRYYIRRPWKLFTQTYWNIRWAWQRASKGYCILDYTNFCEWFCQIAPPMLRDLAENGYGYPGNDTFDTPEKWHEWLNRMADQLEWCSETWREDHDINEYKKPYFDEIERVIKTCKGTEWLTKASEKEKQLSSKYYDREMELYEQSKEQLTKTMMEMSEHWNRLWD